MDLLPTVDELLMLLAESAAYHGRDHPVASAVMQQAHTALLQYQRRIAVASKRYVVATVGLTNVGKSTLLNALLGRKLAPAWNGPCTAFPIEFRWGETYAVLAHFDQSFRRASWPCNGEEDVASRLDGLTGGGGTEPGNNPLRVVVEAPLNILRSGIVIADTPGFGAAQVGDAGMTHETALMRYLQQDVAQVFWVVRAETGIGKREKTFYETHLKTVCDDVVVTGVEGEAWTARNRQRLVSLFRQQIENPFLCFHLVSGPRGCQARQAGDKALLAQAGVAALEERLMTLADPEQRLPHLQRQTMSLATDLIAWADTYQSENGQSLRPLWRPDSWHRFLSRTAGLKDGAALVQLLTPRDQ